MSPFGVCPPLTKVLFFSISCFLCPNVGGKDFGWRESANFVVQFDMATEDASVLNVLAEAKNGDICPYNLVYLEKSASLLVQHCGQLLKMIRVSSGSRYDMPDRKM